MNIVGSPDITNLTVKATWDISGTSPVIRLENLSTGTDLASVSYWFIAKSPTQTIIHEGLESDPDKVGVWTTGVLNDAWPRPFNQIEWSGAPYTLQVFAKDGDGNVFTGDVLSAAICRPNGNLQSSKTTYGLADVVVQVNCDQARIGFQDATNTSYKGLTGTQISSVLKVNYPMDDTGAVPTPFSANNFSYALVPITFAGKGYQFLAASVYDYELSENTFVRIKYLLTDTFGVWCNVDLLPLVCEFQTLSESITNGSCADVQSAQNKINLITPKFFQLLIGIAQPLTGVDVPALIEEIKTIGGFTCDCCDAATGIVPNTSSAIGGYTFQIVSQGGDIGGTVVPNGYNIQFLLHDVKYIVKVCDGSPATTTAFNFVPSVSGDGYTKTYCLAIDVTQFGFDLGTAIANNASLLNFWRALFTSTGGDFNLIVDGSCIFSSSATCDYELTLSAIPVSATYALLTGIKIGSVTTPLTYSFNLTNLAGLQVYLNNLGLGTFVVTNPSGQTALITSVANPNDIQQLYYQVSSTVNQAALSKDCTGFVPISANQVVQNIINYICQITDAQVKTSQQYEICYIDPATQTQKTSIVASGQAVSVFIAELIARGCDTINYVMALGAVNCTAIKAQFPSSVNPMQANDIFLGTKAGACASILPTEAFLYMLIYGQYSAEVLTAFCAMVNLCGGGQPCQPYDVFFATIDAGSPAGDEIDLIVTFVHPDAISNTIRYARIDNTSTPVYITIPGVLPGQSPYTINVSPLLENGQYRVGIRPVYADGRACTETFFDTPPCIGVSAFSASYNGTNIIVTYSVDSSVPDVKVNISYPNGGFTSQVFSNGASISITPPAGVFGSFYITMQPVCNADTGFYGVATAPAIINISAPNNSSIENNSSINQTAVKVFTISPTETQLDTTAIPLAGTAGFYIADGTYASLYVQVDALSRDDLACQLLTGTGTYTGTPSGTNYFVFTGISILGGVTISLTDNASPTYNYRLVGGWNFSIDSVTGSGIPALPATGSGVQTGTQTGMSGTYGFTLSGSVVASTIIIAYVDGTQADCKPVTAAGLYNLSITATSGQIVQVYISSGTC